MTSKVDRNSQYPQRAWFDVLSEIERFFFSWDILLIIHLEKVPIPDEEQNADMSFHLGVQKELVSFVHKIG